MCRLKSYSLSHKCVWRLVTFTGCVLLMLGATSLGFGMKLIEFAEKTDLTPVFAGIPMMVAGFLGLASGLCKKRWLVTGYGIGCVIISMLSIHMNYRFMGKELPSLPVYREQCIKDPKVQHHCDRYIGTIVLCGTAVLMLPFILAALLSCVAAKRTLKKKDCCIIWLTCSKVEPSLPKYNVNLQRYKKSQKTNPVGLLKYKTTTTNGFVCEIPETRPTAEYLPRIPDFTDLAGSPDNPRYPASVMFEYENPNSRQSKIGEFSKDVKLRKENYGLSKTKDQGLALIESGVPVLGVRGDEHAHIERRKRSNHAPHGVATSEVDLSLLEQDYLNRRSYLDEDENEKYYLNEDENEKYYSRAAEEWIQRMVDNIHDSRTRLYAVSDEEELDDVPKRKKTSEINNQYPSKASTDSKDQQEISTATGSPPQDHSPDEEGNVDESATKMLNSEGCNNTVSYARVEPKESSELDKNYLIDERKLSKAEKPFLVIPRRRKFGASSLGDIERELNYEDYDNELVSQSQALRSDNQSEVSTTDCQSETSITDIQSASSFNSQSKSLGHNDSEKDTMEKPATNIGYFGTGELTPHGIITPVGQPFPTGSLSFEFEKIAPTEHARKNWVEFEGEPENREKLLKGKMSPKEYEELTSYLM